MELLANLGLEVASDMEIPEWQKNMVRERIAEYEANPDIAIPWNEARKTVLIKMPNEVVAV
jgi:hypothetical protein